MTINMNSTQSTTLRYYIPDKLSSTSLGSEVATSGCTKLPAVGLSSTMTLLIGVVTLAVEVARDEGGGGLGALVTSGVAVEVVEVRFSPVAGSGFSASPLPNL